MQLTFLAILLVGLAEAGVRHKRITCGRKAEPNEIPWQIQVATIFENYGMQPSFGGTLYNRNTVVTAAHCVEDLHHYITMPTLWIRAGSLSRTNNDTAQWIEVDKFVIHPNASHSSGAYTPFNDVALLRLESDVDITPASKPIPLLTEPAPRDSFMHCIVSGWGMEHTPIARASMMLENYANYLNTTGMKNGDYPDTLRMTYSYPEFNTSICQSMYQTAYPKDNYKVYNDIELCSGFMGCSDSCSGDSGGPLACLRKGSKEYELTGVVSWGGLCGNSAAPGVYASIPHFKPWIEECTAALDRGVSTANCGFVQQKPALNQTEPLQE